MMTDLEAVTPEPILEVRLFGLPEVHVCGSPLPPLHSRRGLWLLALLALRAGRPIDRLQLAGHLWPDSPDSTALHNLRQTLADVRGALGRSAGLLQSESKSLLALDVSAAYIDVLAFDAAALEGTDSALERAAALYRGPLLDGCDEPWATDARAPYAEAYLTVLERLGGGRAAANDPAGAARWLRLAIAADPYRESAHRALMRALAAVGERAAATQVYRELRTRLHDDLNAVPDEETAALFREIRKQTKPGALPAAPTAAPSLEIRRLPTARTELIGREAAVREIAGLFDRTRIVTLTGSGGVGKTRLALQAAADAREDFDDGVAFIQLAALSEPERVPEAVRQGLGIAVGDGRRETVDLLSDALVNRRLLVVLDNCEHLLVACARLVDTLVEYCPALHILTTSRQPLGVPGEAVWRVPGLTVPPAAIGGGDGAGSVGEPRTTVLHASAAVQLFGARARDVAAGWSPCESELEAIGEVCRRLSGIPLAIELAAARTRSLSAEEINNKLDNRFRLLTGGSRTAPDRHQTLRAAIDWSYDLLNAQEKALLCRLSVFAGGWTLEAAEQVGAGESGGGEGVEDWEMLDLLTSLSDKSLVLAQTQCETTRYGLLETVRQYARDRLMESGESLMVRARHANYFLTLAEEAKPKLMGSEQGQWLGVLEEEHDNLRQALTFYTVDAKDAEAGEKGLRLGAALPHFWRIRGHLSEGRERLGALLAHSGGQERTKARADVLNGSGVLAYMQGDYGGARVLYEESLAVWREWGQKSGIAVSLTNLGNVAYEQGEYSRARVLLEESLTIQRELGDRDGIAYALNSLGTVVCFQGDYGGARVLYEESLKIGRELGDKGGIAYSLLNLGTVAYDQGDYDGARVLLEESLAIGRELEDKSGIASSLLNLGTVACLQGDYGGARVLLEESLTIGRELGDKSVITYGLEAFASVTLHETDAERGARLWGAAAALRETIGLPLPPAEHEKQEREIEAARETLGQGAFDAAWAQGRAMTMEQAIDLALEKPCLSCPIAAPVL